MCWECSFGFTCMWIREAGSLGKIQQEVCFESSIFLHRGSRSNHLHDAIASVWGLPARQAKIADACGVREAKPNCNLQAWPGTTKTDGNRVSLSPLLRLQWGWPAEETGALVMKLNTHPAQEEGNPRELRPDFKAVTEKSVHRSKCYSFAVLRRPFLWTLVFWSFRMWTSRQATMCTSWNNLLPELKRNWLLPPICLLICYKMSLMTCANPDPHRKGNSRKSTPSQAKSTECKSTNTNPQYKEITIVFAYHLFLCLFILQGWLTFLLPEEKALKMLLVQVSWWQVLSFYLYLSSFHPH